MLHPPLSQGERKVLKAAQAARSMGSSIDEAVRAAGDQATIDSLEVKGLIRTGEPQTDGDGNVTQSGFIELTTAGRRHPLSQG